MATGRRLYVAALAVAMVLLAGTVGYRLLGQLKVREAIEVLKLNVEAYPNSANAYDSLGEAYMRAGDTQNAIANYQKSLDLDPKNANAAEMLKKLRGQ